MNSADDSRMMIERMGFVMPKTSGNSMRPLIWGGQHCVAVAPLDGEPEIGDILFFRHVQPDGTERNVVHRLVEVRGTGDQRVYITRGDNCLGVEWVLRSEIIGRVAEVHRISGYRPWHAIGAKKFSVGDAAYVRYSRVWAAIWPARRIYYLMRAHARGVIGGMLSLFRK